MYVNAIVAPNALLANYLYSKNYILDLSLSFFKSPEDIKRGIRTTMARLILDEEPSLLHTVDPIYQATALHWASYYGDIESISLFLKRGLSPTEVNVNGEVPLHVAARSNRVEAFLMLREASPSLMTATDNNGLTPEQTARAYDAVDVLRVINQRPNANVNFFIP